MGFSRIAFRLVLVFFAALFAVSGLTGCSHIKQTQFETIGIGGPVWVKRTVRTDEKTLFGSRMVDYEVGFLYCELAEGRGPICVPVEVSDIPRTMTHQGIEFMQGPAQVSTDRRVITYKSLQVDAHQNGQTAQQNGLSVAAQPRAAVSEQGDPDVSSTPRQFEIIYNIENGWNDSELKFRLAAHLGKPIVLVSRSGKFFRGTLIEAKTESDSPGPRIIISTDGTRSFLPLKSIKFIGK